MKTFLLQSTDFKSLGDLATDLDMGSALCYGTYNEATQAHHSSKALGKLK